MRLAVFFILSIIFITGCSSGEEKRIKNEITERKVIKDELREKISHYFKESIKESADEITIDSVVILRVESSTAKEDSVASFNKVKNAIDKMMFNIDLKQEEAKLIAKQAVLWESMDRKLSEMYSMDAKKVLDDLKEDLESVKLLRQSMLDLSELISSNSIDSVTQTGYSVLFNIKARDIKNVANDLDSLTMLFDLDKRIKNYHN